jgi:hypothetical protein
VAGSPWHATLSAGVALPVVFEQDYDRIEVVNVDGTAAVYFRVGQTNPGVAAEGSHVLPAAIGSVELDVTTSGPTEVRLISSGTPKVSVRGVINLTR